MGNLITCAKHRQLFLPDLKCAQCVEESILMDEILDIEGRFYGWTLHETQEEDFAWLVKTLKGIIENGSI